MNDIQLDILLQQYNRVTDAFYCLALMYTRTRLLSHAYCRDPHFDFIHSFTNQLNYVALCNTISQGLQVFMAFEVEFIHEN